MATYVDSTDLIDRFDVREVSRLVSDTGSPIDESSLPTNRRLLACLDDAEGEVVGYLRRGGRYTDDSLAALTGSSLAMLKRCICEIAMMHLLRRRPSFTKEVLDAYASRAEQLLKTLQDGVIQINSDPASDAAGRPVVEGISRADYEEMNTIVHRAHRYFPTFRLPGNKG